MTQGNLDNSIAGIYVRLREMRIKGLKFFDFGIGEPGFSTDNLLKKSAHEAIEIDHNRYPPINGFPQTLDAIIDYYQRYYPKTSWQRSNICITNGVKQGVFNILLSEKINYPNQQKKVALIAPFWNSYAEMCNIIGHKIEVVESVEQIKPDVDWIIFNNVRNPDGYIYKKAEMDYLVAIMKQNNEMRIISDDIYENLVFFEKKWDLDHSFMKYISENHSDLMPRIVWTNGISKSFSLTGYRLGWIMCCDPQIMSSVSYIMSQTTSGVNFVSQAVCHQAMQTEIFLEYNRALKVKRDLMHVQLEGKFAYYTFPQGGLFFMLDMRQQIEKLNLKDDIALSQYLINLADDNNQGIITIPGSMFYLPGYLRLSFAASDEDIIQGCNRLKEILS